MNKRIRVFFVLVLVCSLLISNAGLAFGEQLESKKFQPKPDGLYVYEESSNITLEDIVIGPRDVGHPDRKSLLSSYNYEVTQDDVQNWGLYGNAIVSNVSLGVAYYFQNPLGVALADYFGGKAGTAFENYILNNMEWGSYNTQSSQTYEFCGGDTWIWRYGNSYVYNDTTGGFSSSNCPAPFDMYAYGL